jgi:hypothetical protein
VYCAVFVVPQTNLAGSIGSRDVLEGRVGGSSDGSDPSVVHIVDVDFSPAGSVDLVNVTRLIPNEEEMIILADG